MLTPSKRLQIAAWAASVTAGAILGACGPTSTALEISDAGQGAPGSDRVGASDAGAIADRVQVDRAAENDTGGHGDLDASHGSDTWPGDTSVAGDAAAQPDTALAAVDASQVDAAGTGECADDGDCGSERDCVGGVCRDTCLFTCLLAETGDLCVDGHCVDCETSDDCAGNTFTCDPETYACIELGFRPDPVQLECDSCPGGTLCGGGGDTTTCGTPGFGASWCTPGASVSGSWSYLENGWVRIGADLRRGAAIGHFSSPTSDGNILDENDTGRYLQQSYYGDNLGGSWNGEPWHFNPVQGGDSDNVPSEVVEYCNDGSTIYAKTIPRDWGGLGVTPTVMEEWITLAGDIAVIRFRFEYLGDWDNAARHQEVPAFFVRRELENLTMYQGSAPWTGGALTSILPNQLETAGNQRVDFDEPWLAYLNADGWGVGLYKRGEDEATSYRYKSIGEETATSYFAFLDTFALVTGLVHDYTSYMKIGSGGELRSRFQQLHQAGL